VEWDYNENENESSTVRFIAGLTVEWDIQLSDTSAEREELRTIE
jgi:hypothetical protein